MLSSLLNLFLFSGISKKMKGKEMFFKNFDFNKRCENDVEDNNEKNLSRLTDTLSQKIEFTAYCFHRDQPPA